MNESNSLNDANVTEPKASQNVDQRNKDPGFETINKNDIILPNVISVMPSKSVVIDVDSVPDEKTKNIDDREAHADVKLNINDEYNKNLVYAYYGQQIQPPKTTWVMYQVGGGLPPGETPLNYDPVTRNLFVRLVFSIVLFMLMVTGAFVSTVLFTDLRDIFKEYGFIISIPAIILMVVLNISMACSSCTRVFPCNVCCLILAVCGMSLICGYITSRYRTEVVFYAVIATCVVVFVCLLLAYSSFDFTSWMIYIVVIAAAFGSVAMVASLAMIVSGTYIKLLHLGILLVGTVINVVVLTMELQTILGGRAVELCESDYALGAFLIYTSIVDIFLKILQISGFDE